MSKLKLFALTPSHTQVVMGTVVSHEHHNRNLATAASMALRVADNPPPRTSIGVVRIEVSYLLENLKIGIHFPLKTLCTCV